VPLGAVVKDGPQRVLGTKEVWPPADRYAGGSGSSRWRRTVAYRAWSSEIGGTVSNVRAPENVVCSGGSRAVVVAGSDG
jgi:hypothetical protein